MDVCPRPMKSLAGLVLIALASVAFAGGGGVAVGQPRANALQLVLDASARAQHGDHAGAAALYRQAYVLDQDASLLPVIANEYRRDGHNKDAMSLFCSYLAAAPNGPQADAAVKAVRELGGNDNACMPGAKAPIDLPARGWTPPLTPATEAVPLREMTPVMHKSSRRAFVAAA
jgi:hypothetical protein